MSNKSLVEESSRLKALKISNYLEEESLGKIAKEKDLSVLKELYLIYYQNDKIRLSKATEERIISLGGNLY